MMNQVLCAEHAFDRIQTSAALFKIQFLSWYILEKELGSLPVHENEQYFYYIFVTLKYIL